MARAAWRRDGCYYFRTDLRKRVYCVCVFIASNDQQQAWRDNTRKSVSRMIFLFASDKQNYACRRPRRARGRGAGKHGLVLTAQRHLAINSRPRAARVPRGASVHCRCLCQRSSCRRPRRRSSHRPNRTSSCRGPLPRRARLRRGRGRSVPRRAPHAPPAGRAARDEAPPRPRRAHGGVPTVARSRRGAHGEHADLVGRPPPRQEPPREPAAALAGAAAALAQAAAAAAAQGAALVQRVEDGPRGGGGSSPPRRAPALRWVRSAWAAIFTAVSIASMWAATLRRSASRSILATCRCMSLLVKT